MNHAVVNEHLADYLEGDLALDLRALVDAHLDGCEICANEVREMQQTIRLLRALPEPETPPMIAANVMRRIRAGETQPSLFERFQRGLGSILEPSFVLPAAAMAVAALVFFAIQGRERFSVPIGSGAGSERVQPRELVVENSAAPALGLPIEDEARSFGASAAREPAVAPVPTQSLAARPAAPADGPGDGSRRALERDVERVETTLAARNPSGRLDGRVATPATAERVGQEEFAGDRMAMAPWEEGQRARAGAAPARSVPAGSIFGAPVLAQGFAPSAASNRTGGALTNAVSTVIPSTAMPSTAIPSTAMPTALSDRTSGSISGARIEESSGEDPRDAWLARALEDPVEFAHYISRHNLAEQEIWVARLAERASARGLLDEVVDALRRAGDEKAGWLAEDFSAAAESGRSTDSRGR